MPAHVFLSARREQTGQQDTKRERHKHRYHVKHRAPLFIRGIGRAPLGHLPSRRISKIGAVRQGAAGSPTDGVGVGAGQRRELRLSAEAQPFAHASHQAAARPRRGGGAAESRLSQAVYSVPNSILLSHPAGNTTLQRSRASSTSERVAHGVPHQLGERLTALSPLPAGRLWLPGLPARPLPAVQRGRARWSRRRTSAGPEDRRRRESRR